MWADLRIYKIMSLTDKISNLRKLRDKASSISRSGINEVIPKPSNVNVRVSSSSLITDVTTLSNVQAAVQLLLESLEEVIMSC